MVVYFRLFVFCYFFVLKQKTADEMRMSDWISDVCAADLRLPALGSPSLHPATKGWAASYPGAELTLFGFGAGTVGAPPPGRVHRLASGQTLGIKPAIMGVSCSLEASAIAVGRRVSDGLRRAVDRLLPTRSEEHTSELQSLMRSSYYFFCFNKTTSSKNNDHI